MKWAERNGNGLKPIMFDKKGKKVVKNVAEFLSEWRRYKKDLKKVDRNRKDLLSREENILSNYLSFQILNRAGEPLPKMSSTRI